MNEASQNEWKRRVKWNNTHLQTLDHIQDKSYLLTERQANALLNVTKQMSWQSRWSGDITLDEIDSFASEIADRLMTPNECGACIVLPPYHPSIEWFPNNPYTEPDLVGDGYIFPSWYIAGIPAQILYDADLGAAITSIERMPSGSWPFIVPASGWPRFRVNFNGTGVIELHLSSIHKGSLLQVQVDSETFDVEWIDVHQSAIAIPPETANVVIWEREFTTGGDHWIDCTIIPTLDSLPIPFTFGGGLVKVELCGFTNTWTGEGADLSGLQMRLDAECGMEYSIDDGGEWLPVFGWDTYAASCFLGDAGANGLDGDDGTNGTDGDDGSDGNDGTDGDDGQTANEYPPQPDPETDEMCGAVWYIAEQVEAVIQQSITDALTVSLADYLLASLQGGGFISLALDTFYNWLLVTVDATLSANVNVAIPYVAEHLYCTNLDIAETKIRIAADTAYSANARDTWIMALDSYTDGKIALWAFVGSQDATRDCSSFVCAELLRLSGHGNADMALVPYGSPPYTGTVGTYDAGNDWYVGGETAQADHIFLYVTYTFAAPTAINGATIKALSQATRTAPNSWFHAFADGVKVVDETIPVTGSPVLRTSTIGATTVTEFIFFWIIPINATGEGKMDFKNLEIDLQ